MEIRKTKLPGVLGSGITCASVVRNPSMVAIFGSTDHSGTSPFSEKAVIVRKDVACAPCKLRECPTDHRCMTAITADDVIGAALDLAHRTGVGRP